MAKKKFPAATTKAELIRMGVTDVTRDGKVYVNGKRKHISIMKCRHKYGTNRNYPYVALTDKEAPKVPITAHWTTKDGATHDYPSWRYKTVLVPVSRCVYVWHVEDIPAGMDCDHINGDPFDNRVDNLQVITRKENLLKRSLTWNEIAKLYREKEREMKTKKEKK